MNVDEGWFKNNQFLLNFCITRVCWHMLNMLTTPINRWSTFWLMQIIIQIFIMQVNVLSSVKTWHSKVANVPWWRWLRCSKVINTDDEQNYGLWCSKPDQCGLIKYSWAKLRCSNIDQLRMIKCSSSCWTARGLMMIGSLMMIKIINNIER